MADDKTGDKLFADIKSIDQFYIELSVFAGDKLENRCRFTSYMKEILAN